MATTTSLMGLTKPAVSEAADISVINGNFEIIDAFIKGTGLGTTAKSIDSLDNATTFGIYTSNAGAPTSSYYWCLVLPFNDNYIVQIASHSSTNPTVFVTRRKQHEEGWQPWEYFNPVMNAGTEYRTTERYGGKAVYKKRIVYVSGNGTNPEIGTAGEIKTVNIPHGVSGFGEIVSVSAHMGTYALPIMDSNGYLTIANSVTSTYINLRTNGVWSGERTWSFDLAYTKA